MNSTNQNMTLVDNPLAQALSAEAGPELQPACSNPPTATQLIIYGLSKEAIKETKSKLEGRLQKETKTIVWDEDGPEAPYISRLTNDQVPAHLHRQLYLTELL